MTPGVLGNPGFSDVHFVHCLPSRGTSRFPDPLLPRMVTRQNNTAVAVLFFLMSHRGFGWNTLESMVLEWKEVFEMNNIGKLALKSV